MSYQVQIVDGAAQAPDALWDSGFAPPLEGRWWYETMERSGLEDQFRFFYALIERDGAAVGLAPLFVADVPIELVVPEELMPLFRIAGRVLPSLLVQRTLFVGSPCSDEGSVAVAAGEDRAAVFLALGRALDVIARKHRAWMIAWKDFIDRDAADLARVVSEAGFFPAVSYPGTEIDFISSGKEDYFARMKPSHRQQLRRKLRRSVEQAPLDISVIQTPPSQVMDEVLGLFMQTYERAATRFERLDRRVFDEIANYEGSWFILLRHRDDGRLVAFMLCFLQGDQVINKFIGLDYGRPKDWMLYFRLWDACVDWCLSRGVRRLQSGQTGYRVKIELGNRLIPLTNYGRHRNPLVNFVYAMVGKTISWATLDPELARHLESHPDNASAAPAAWTDGKG